MSGTVILAVRRFAEARKRAVAHRTLKLQLIRSNEMADKNSGCISVERHEPGGDAA